KSVRAGARTHDGSARQHESDEITCQLGLARREGRESSSGFTTNRNRQGPRQPNRMWLRPVRQTPVAGRAKKSEVFARFYRGERQVVGTLNRKSPMSEASDATELVRLLCPHARGRHGEGLPLPALPAIAWRSRRQQT